MRKKHRRQGNGRARGFETLLKGHQIKKIVSKVLADGWVVAQLAEPIVQEALCLMSSAS